MLLLQNDDDDKNDRAWGKGRQGGVQLKTWEIFFDYLRF